jgi:hypothetical protein
MNRRIITLSITTLLLIILSHTTLATEWSEAENYTLTPLSPSITVRGYTIEALDFDWYGSVHLRATHNSADEEAIIYRGESLTFFNENLRITATDVSDINRIRDEGKVTIGKYPCCPPAEITVELAEIEHAAPNMDVVIHAYWSGKLGAPIKVNTTLNNTGNTNLKNITLTLHLDRELKLLREDELSTLTHNKTAHTLTRRWEWLYTNNTAETRFQLTPRTPPNKTSYTITAEATATTQNGTTYYGYDSVVLKLKPAINIKKTATRDVVIGDYIYPGARDTFTAQRNTIYIQLIIENQQSYTISDLQITDQLPAYFTTSQPLEWHIKQLKPDEKIEIKYTAQPQRPSLYVTLPAATAEWIKWNRKKTATSNTPAIAIHGPYIIAKKKTQRNGERVNVTLEIENIGDFPVHITLTDPPPAGANLTSGNNTYSGLIKPSEKKHITYTLKMEEDINQSTPIITFKNKAYSALYETILMEERVSTTQPKHAIITRIARAEETPRATPSKTPQGLIQIINNRYPWIEGAIPIILLIAAIIILWAIQPRE